MNKFNRWLALLLINAKIARIERKACKALRKLPYQSWGSANKQRTTMLDMIDDLEYYVRMQNLRINIESINNPWQGVFNHNFTLYPKNPKYIEAFEPFEITKPQELPLPPSEQLWADFNTQEFFERLELEKAGWDALKMERVPTDDPLKTNYVLKEEI